MASKHYKLTDEQWEQIKDFIPNAKTGRPPKDNRLILNALLWLTRSSTGWEDLPECYGYWKTIYNCLSKWCDDGTFISIFHVLKLTSTVQALKRSSKQ